MKNPDALIIGAGPAGLACAASMGGLGMDVKVLEKGSAVGTVWRRHYDRLHLHTDRGHSGLPGLPMPRSYPRYPSRAQVVEYLEAYAEHFGLTPRVDTTARRAARTDGTWQVDTNAGVYRAPVL